MIDAPYQTFGWWYLVAGLMAATMAVGIRFALTKSATPVDGPPALDAYRLAWLAGGPRRVACAALAGLAQRDAVVADPTRRRLARGPGRPGTSAVDLALWNCVAATEPAKCRSVIAAAAEPVRQVGESMRQAGLTPTPGQAWLIRLVPAVAAASPAVLGLLRLVHRVHEHRPVLLLGLMCLAPVYVGGLLAAGPTYRSRAGKAALASARARHHDLIEIGYRRAARTRPDKIAMAVALYGPRPLRQNGLAWLGDLLWPISTNTGSLTDDGGGTSSFGTSDGGGGGHGGGGGFGADPF